MYNQIRRLLVSLSHKIAERKDKEIEETRFCDNLSTFECVLDILARNYRRGSYVKISLNYS